MSSAKVMAWLTALLTCRSCSERSAPAMRMMVWAPPPEPRLTRRHWLSRRVEPMRMAFEPNRSGERLRGDHRQPAGLPDEDGASLGHARAVVVARRGHVGRRQQQNSSAGGANRDLQSRMILAHVGKDRREKLSRN